MKFSIDAGHNAPKRDIGAGKHVSGHQNLEDYLTNLVAKSLGDKLKARGHSVVYTCPGLNSNFSSVEQSLQKRCQVANASKSDYFVSIHFNAFSSPAANGAEVYVFNEKSAAKQKAAAVLKNLCNLGFLNRKIKTFSFYVLKHTRMPAMLVECCFLTSPKDMDLITINATKHLYKIEQLADAIFYGLIGQNYMPPKGNEEKKINLSIPGKVEIEELQKNPIAIPVKASAPKPVNVYDSTINGNKVSVLKPGTYELQLMAEEENSYSFKINNKIVYINSNEITISAID